MSKSLQKKLDFEIFFIWEIASDVQKATVENTRQKAANTKAFCENTLRFMGSNSL